MARIFQYKDFPFLLTLLLGLLGYQLNSITNALINSPAIEYNISSKIIKTDVDTAYADNICTITNLSNSKSFDDLNIDLRYPDNAIATIDHLDIHVLKPSSLHDFHIDSVSSKIAIFYIDKLQPGLQYQLCYKTKYATKIADINPDLNLTTKNTVRLVQSSLTTWIIKNYSSISLSLCGLWLILIIIYFIRLKPVL